LASTPSLLDSARAVETACIHHFSSSFIQIRTQLGDYTPLHGSASGIL
jgi:DNA-binding IclR family transcriptional regulator